MYCRRCGTKNEDNNQRCIRCGDYLHAVIPTIQYPNTPVQRVPTYLAPAILVTLLCCLPLGIPAIVYAAQVDSKLNAGDVAGAIESSGKAKMWTWLSFALGLTFGVIWFFASVLAGV